ncbi:MAG: hypothetical protein ACK5MV_12570 [Aminipila sp.]
MKKRILKKGALVFLLILILRAIYVLITKEPYINGVFISTALGFMIATVIVEIIFFKKSNKRV